MKRIVALFMWVVLGVACLSACTNSNEGFVEKSYIGEGEEITEIYMDVQDRQIEVMLSPDNQVHINYFENSKEYYDISVSDNHRLTMTAASNKEWRDYIGVKASSGSSKILLQLPDAFLVTLKLSTTGEDILLSPLAVIGDISLSAQGGDIIFDKLAGEKSINLSGKNGDITGSIIGSYEDYAISCDSKKGESNLPPSKNGGVKNLAVSNNNGDIDITFISK